MDERAAIRFINSIPEGFWTAYSDVAAVCGSNSPRSIGVWLRRSGGRINNYWRVLNVDGEVPDEFVGGGSGPVTPENARDKLRREGVWIDGGGRARQRQRFTPVDYAAFLRDGTIRDVEKARPSAVVAKAGRAATTWGVARWRHGAYSRGAVGRGNNADDRESQGASRSRERVVGCLPSRQGTPRSCRR